MRFSWLLVLALAVTACGAAATDTDDGVASLSDPRSDTATETVEMTDEEAAIAFTACMRDNGVEMEDPTVDADGNVTPGRPTNLGEPGEGQADPELREAMRAAFEECGDLLGGTAFGFTQVDQTELQDQLIELAACLRDQGLDVADPDLSQLGPGNERDGGGPFGIDFQDPEVQEAMEQCEDLIPNVGREFGAGPGAPRGEG